MADNSQKTPYAQTANSWATKRINDAIALAGKALPVQVTSVTGQIVTVKFLLTGIFTLPNDVKMPIFGPEYARSPTQVGDLGVVFPIDTYLGGVSGLGGGVAGLSTRANLSTLVFFPVGSKNWTSVDPNVFTLYGPGGVTLRDSGSNMQLILTPAEIELGAGATRGVARLGDAVTSPSGPGTIVSASTKVFSV